MGADRPQEITERPSGDRGNHNSHLVPSNEDFQSYQREQSQRTPRANAGAENTIDVPPLSQKAENCDGNCEPDDMRIDRVGQREVIDNLIAKANEKYIFPDRAEALRDRLESRFSSGAYDGFQSARAFAAALTDDVQAVTNDKHFTVGFSATPLPEAVENPSQAEILADEKKDNFGIREASMFPLEVGYLKLNYFGSTNEAREAIDKEMIKLADASALIIDLRENGGGDPATVAHLLSHILPPGTHVNTVQWRNGTEQPFHTASNPPEQRFGSEKPVYVITSGDTFSGAEEFAYTVKSFGRGTISGDRTAGGAHPANVFKLNNNFVVSIPEGRAVNPITGSNWEGTGVSPDIKSSDAFSEAYRAALKPR